MDVNDRVKRAYNEFKGGRCGDVSIPEAKRVLNEVSTARTYRWNGVDVVAACFKTDGEEVPETEAIPERHDLVEVGRRTGETPVIYYAREEEVKAARDGASSRLKFPQTH